MSFKESDLTALYSKYLRTNYCPELKHTNAIEFKCKKGNVKLHLVRDFQPQQLPELFNAFSGCVYHKMSDLGIGIKPFDSFQICYSPAYVGVMWYRPRKPKILYLIHIKEIMKFLQEDKKLISETDAVENATYIIKL
jgi:hypothetical protein